jgi:hypothetical protein
MSGTNWVRLERWAVATAFVMTLTVVLGWLGQESPALASGFAATTAYPSPTPAVPVPDSYEDDDACGQAALISLDDRQAHTFHDSAEQDWLRFSAEANTTYRVEITKIGTSANPVVSLYNSCGDVPTTVIHNPYGTTVQLQWNATRTGSYFLKLQPYDPSQTGLANEYTVIVRRDELPPAMPGTLRCFSISPTVIGVQWSRSTSIDVEGYRVLYQRVGAADSGEVNVQQGLRMTYAEVEGLTPDAQYTFQVAAFDYSHNLSPAAGPTLPCRAQNPPDTTPPVVTLQNPQIQEVYTTTTNLLTFTGLAEDQNGSNPGRLSRVSVTNRSRGQTGWDYTLTDANATFRVDNLRLSVGPNQINVKVFDEAGNSTERTLIVNRVGSVRGAALIVAGHNETFALQTNIYNAANRAFRVFLAAGYDPDEIYYIAPTAQDADEDGTDDVDAAATPAAIQAALETWARQPGRLGPEIPFFLYFVDHGLDEKFCVNGCSESQSVSPTQLNSWLDDLENATGTHQITVLMEACRSGSFINRDNGGPSSGLGKSGRVVITSTGAANNAYASSEGAFFSDAFFSCAVNSNNLRQCFEQASSAVAATGVHQTPWLDDNGDGIYNDGDGELAAQRSVLSAFTSTTPTIEQFTVTRTFNNATLEATVGEGVEEIAFVWANVYPPSFREPVDITLNLNLPTVRLDPVAGEPGVYRFQYTNGMTEPGFYRVVFYAQDRLGYQADPQVFWTGGAVFLPSIYR